MRAALGAVCALVLGVVLAALPALAKPPKPQLTITEVFVDFANEQIIIAGQHLDNTAVPSVLLGDDPTPLTLSSYGGSVIAVELPANLPDGDYRLAVSTGQGSWQNDTYDLTIGAVGPQGPLSDAPHAETHLRLDPPQPGDEPPLGPAAGWVAITYRTALHLRAFPPN